MRLHHLIATKLALSAFGLMTFVLTSCGSMISEFSTGMAQGLYSSMGTYSGMAGNYIPASPGSARSTAQSLDYLLDPRTAIDRVMNGTQIYVNSNDPNVQANVRAANTSARIANMEYRLNQQEAALGINSSAYGSSSSSSQSSSSSSSSTSSRNCSWCNGSGQQIENRSNTLYGATPVKKKCNVCGFEYMSSTIHIHSTCSHCGGSGKSR